MAKDDRAERRGPSGLTERDGRTHLAFLREAPSARNPFVLSSFLLGFGMGGFLDGIFLHQILQWHHLISNVLPPETLERLRTNVVADGLFNLAMWAVVAGGLAVLWRALKQGQSRLISTRSFVGWLIVGWGGFNLFDTIAFHALLGWHHIRQVPNFLVYDIVFCTGGIALVAAGLFLAREKQTRVH